MTNPSDTLRRAAEIIRERAAAATPGPWEVDGYPFNRYGVSGPGHIVIEPASEADDWDTVDVVNARWIAMMSPELAQPLIDWLQSQADEMETLTSWNGYWTALDLARAIVEKVDG